MPVPANLLNVLQYDDFLDLCRVNSSVLFHTKNTDVLINCQADFFGDSLPGTADCMAACIITVKGLRKRWKPLFQKNKAKQSYRAF